LRLESPEQRGERNRNDKITAALSQLTDPDCQRTELTRTRAWQWQNSFRCLSRKGEMLRPNTGAPQTIARTYGKKRTVNGTGPSPGE